MYLHLGEGVVVSGRDVLGIFDLDNISVAADSRSFLHAAQQGRRIVTVGHDVPKAVVLCCHDGREVLYLTQMAASTLKGRVL